MEFKKYQNIMRSFSLLILLFSFQVSFACIGDDFGDERTRVAIFMAKRSGFAGLSPFNYTSYNYTSTYSFYTGQDIWPYDTNEASNIDLSEKELNCLEWKKKLGNKINVDDIYDILYHRKTAEFVNAYESKSFRTAFKGNTFVNSLLMPKNKGFLDCVLLAKKIEHNIRTWQINNYSIDINDYKKKLLNTKDAFLRKRYAFLILRYYFYKDNSKEVIRLYNTYFGNGLNSIIELWALDYRGSYFTNNGSSSYALHNFLAGFGYKTSLILHNKDLQLLMNAMRLPENRNAKSIALATQNFHNPKPCLDVIKKIGKASPNNILLAFLIGREINKIEDWTFSIKYTGFTPSVLCHGNWDDSFEKCIKENYKNDISYLRNFRGFLINMHQETIGEQRDFVAAAIAHLYLMDNEADLAKKYVDMISDKSNESIQVQKNILLAMASLKTENLKSKKVRYQLLTYFNSVENLAKKEKALQKCLYSLYLVASDEFHKKGDEAVAALFLIKSNYAEEYKMEDREMSDFDYIKYLDRHAKIKDIDYLIGLKEKQNTTSFEKFISLKTLAPNVNIYKNLKGTMAFRDDDLDLAYTAFSTIPNSFWNNEEKEDCESSLKQDPFIPKDLTRSEDRKYDYYFNKADFIAKLIQLKKQNTAASNLQLGHAYFNVSSIGNSWAMVCYYKSGDNKNEKYQNDNYCNLKMAKMYYEKALKLSKNDEEKALANLMIFECNYYRYEFSGFNSYALDYFPYKYSGFYIDPVYYIFYPFYNYDFGIGKFKGVKELTNFYTVYRSTETFKKYNCPTIENFIN
ncbi:hypothetical protein [Flavobacterium humidisoli]|uniref:Sel1 repeat family protein n=1 Tax=Flavobacterium humidisoli TaxID=2937442 RepID=A0ABY4LP56_9FLAO|nr:hypothetical protein [Flavobacterium humidisoli]UPZ14023.1 hypothetical protein M0M44_14815 [Flavobacterium humidisoli]